MKKAELKQEVVKLYEETLRARESVMAREFITASMRRENWEYLTGRLSALGQVIEMMGYSYLSSNGKVELFEKD